MIFSLIDAFVQRYITLKFLIFSEMIDRGVDDDPFHPAFKRGFHIIVSGRETSYLPKDFQKTVICNFHSVIIIVSIPHTYSHGIAIKVCIELFLTLSIQPDTLMNNMFKILACQQDVSFVYDKIAKKRRLVACQIEKLGAEDITQPIGLTSSA